MPVKEQGIDIQPNIKVMVAKIGNLNHYVSRIEYIDENSFYIPTPIFRRNALHLVKGDDVDVKFAGEQESYTFRSRVLGVKEDKVTTYRLSLPQKIVRIQQRNFVRLPVLLDVHYGSPPAQDELPDYHRAKILDISGGGLKIATDQEHYLGDTLQVKLDLPPVLEREKIGYSTLIEASVVRVQKVNTNGEELYHLGLRFIDVKEKQQDKIVCFIFQKMTADSRYS